MGKHRGRKARRTERDSRATVASAARTTERPSAAERHEFTGGLLGHDPGTWASANISELLALGVDAVYSSVLLIADGVSQASWGEWKGTAELSPSRIVRRPMATLTRREWTWLVTATMALYNICPLREVGGRDTEGVAMSLVPIAPTRLAPIGDRLYLDGAEVDPAEFHFIRRTLWPTVSAELGTVLRLARDTFAAASASSAYSADWWEHGGAPVTVLTTDQELTNDQADAIGLRWRTAREAGPSYPAVLGKGARADAFGADIGGSSAGAAGDRLLAAVARYFRIPPHGINAPSQAGGLTYTNTEAAGIDLVRYTLGTYAQAIGDCISDLLPGDYLAGRQARLDLSALTMAEQLTRYQAWAIAVGGPWMAADEVREREGLGPREIAPAPASAPVAEGIA